MKILFCHDGPTIIDDKGNAYPHTYTESVLERYYTLADSCTLISRTKCLKTSEIKYKKANKEKFDVVSLPNIATLKGQLFFLKQSKEILLEELNKADLVIIKLPSITGNLALEIVKKLGKPYLIELVACPWDSLWNHSIKGKCMAPYYYYKTRKNIKNAKSVVYITERIMQLKYPTKGIAYTCSDVDLRSFSSEVLYKRYDHIDSMKDRKILVGSIGAVDVRYKGHEYVIRAIAILKKIGINIEYHIVGRGCNKRLKRVAEKLNIEDSIVFVGEMCHEEIFSFLDKIDIYIQPSLAEAQGRSLIEAMSRACPCICTNVGGMVELIPSMWRVPKANSSQIANKILDLLNSNMKEVAKSNYDFSKTFDADCIKEKYKEILKRTIDLEEKV